MNNIFLVIQIILSLGLLNVWVIRFKSATPYRGGSAKNLKEEFQVYGLPQWFVYFIGALKLCTAVALMVGIWISEIVFPASLVLVILMLGALLMHIKVKDPVIKSIPALMMFLLSLSLVLPNI